MSEDNKKSYGESSIDEILKEFQVQKTQAKQDEAENAELEQTDEAQQKARSNAPLEPPKKLYENESSLPELLPDEPTPEKSCEAVVKDEKLPEKEHKKRKPHKKADRKKLIKTFGIILLCIALFFASVFGIGNAIKSSKTAYLKPYIEKYPDVDFPDGIQEKYCDRLGKNPKLAGIISIDDIGLNEDVSYKSVKNGTVYAEKSAAGCKTVNHVIYIESNALEEYYSTADAYNNKASGFISYSDLVTDRTFKVIGAFYTNTEPGDDNGYVFPYNVTEEQTPESAFEFLDRLHTHFLYDTGITPARTDTLITISCPTDLRENFRFVIVGVEAADKTKPTAQEKKANIYYPQVIFDEKGETSTFNLTKKWYPEIVRRATENNETVTTVIKQSAKDYN